MALAAARLYRRPADLLYKTTNTFALPTYTGLLGYPVEDKKDQQKDRNGGLMPSLRKDGAQEALRRVHAGLDFLTFPGDPVYAPMTGVVAAVGPMTGKQGLQLIAIASGAELAAVLYVEPDAHIRVGMKITARERIGKAQNILLVYPADSTPNHIHVKFTDSLNRRFNPYDSRVTNLSDVVNGRFDLYGDGSGVVERAPGPLRDGKDENGKDKLGPVAPPSVRRTDLPRTPMSSSDAPTPGTAP